MWQLICCYCDALNQLYVFVVQKYSDSQLSSRFVADSANAAWLCATESYICQYEHAKNIRHLSTIILRHVGY